MVPRALWRCARWCAAAWSALFPDRVLRRSMTVSSVLHLTLLLVFTIMPAWPRHMHWESAPLVVSLVSLPVPAPPDPPAPKPRPEPQKPKIKAEKTPAPKTQPKPELKPPPDPPREEAPPDSTKALAVEKDLRVTARVDEQQFVYDYYLQVVAAKISAVWEPPAGLLAGGRQTITTVRFRILREGHVHGVTIEESSPLPLFDRSTQEAVLRAQPFPPFPPGYAGRWLTVHLRFAHGE